MKLAPLLCVLSMTLVGCATKPIGLVITPPATQGEAHTYQRQNFSIEIQDKRQKKHLLKVIRSEEPVHHEPGNDIFTNLSNSIKQSFDHQGITINPYAGNNILVEVLQLETVVKQNMVTYEASTAIELKITVAKPDQAWFKVFTGHTDRNGYMNYHVRNLEQDLDTLVAKVLADIYADDYIQSAIRH